jgi:uncharacterized membrane protein
VIPIESLLYKRRKPTHTIDYPSLVFLAEATEEPFQEVTVVTLKSHYNDLCQEMAIQKVQYPNDGEIWEAEVQQMAERLMDTGGITVREFVEVGDDRNVTIAIDADTITDSEVDKALGYLAEAKIPGTTYFGSYQVYSSTDIKEVINATVEH